MTYKELFEGWDCRDGYANHTLYVNCYRPDKLSTVAEILQNNERASRTITELESYITALQEYQQELAKRAAQLETMGYKLSLTLKRYKHYQGGVEYYITLTKTLDDGTQVKELSETYTGKERRQAIARFEALKKQRPGIEAVKDIEKESWER